MEQLLAQSRCDGGPDRRIAEINLEYLGRTSRVMPLRKLLPGWLDVSGKVLISADTVWEKVDFEGG